MSPPQGIGTSAPVETSSPKQLSSAEERGEFLAFEQFLVDSSHAGDPSHLISRWKSDREYRLTHQKITDIVDYVSRFIKRDSTITPSKLEPFLKQWIEDPSFDGDPLNAVVLTNLRRILGQFLTNSNKEQAVVIAQMLPSLPEETKPQAKLKTEEKKSAGESVRDPKKNWSIGLELHNDSATLEILDFIGIPLSAFATEKNHLTVRPTLEFPMGSWVGTMRLNGGFFSARGIPGANAEDGMGYRAGIDFGLVNPYSESHERSGIGLELTGIASHAGQASGVEAPGPLVRMHFWQQSDLNFRLGNNFELGFNTFLNNQETYVTLGNDASLFSTMDNARSDFYTNQKTYWKNQKAPPFAVLSSLFARSPFRWLGVSGRIYWNGVPERDTVEDLKKPFRPGEGAPKIGNLWTGMVINMNRREDIPAFANTQVLMGTFWPLGMESSMTQFDTIGLGLTFYSLQDGYFMARNAQLRGEIWKRDDSWVLRGLMLGGDALMLGYNIYRTVTAKADPPYEQTIPEFIAEPGSVTDFNGRAGRINLALQGFELGLSALDATGIAGDVTDENRTRFWVTSALMGLTGFAGFLFSGSLTGNGCASDGPGGLSVALRCGFPAQREKYFIPDSIDATPEHMRSFEDQYIVSSVAAGLASWGVTRLLQPVFIDITPSHPNDKAPATKVAKPTTPPPQIGLNFGNGGFQVSAGGQFP